LTWPEKPTGRNRIAAQLAALLGATANRRESTAKLHSLDVAAIIAQRSNGQTVRLPASTNEYIDHWVDLNIL
jgi:hypothetical protein